MDNKITPAYLLRSYIWQLLKLNLGWTEANYGNLVPIVPVAEEPEISVFDKPYIVYGYALDGTGDLHARGSGSMTLVIYDANFRNLTQALNVIVTALERQDESARDVNRYTSSVPAFIGLRFGYIRIGFTEGGTPETTEGGRQSALVNISFEYYTELDVKTKFEYKSGVISEWS